MTAVLEPPVRHWACPSCTTVDRTQKSEPHTQLHPCEGLGGFIAPLIETRHVDAKVDARHVLLAREDYVGESGMPVIASCITEHGDGSNDLTAYAPCAVSAGQAHIPFEINRAQGYGHPLNVTPWTANAGGGARARYQFHDTKLARMARIARRLESRMAWTAPGAYNAYYVWALGQATGRPNPSADAFKTALYGAGVTPVQSATAALTQYNGAGSTWVTGNEASGTGYTAGGVAVTPVTWTQGTNVITFTSSGSPQWTAATFAANGCLVYDTTTSNQAISWNYFGGTQSVTAGTFSITWNASGICTITC